MMWAGVLAAGFFSGIISGMGIGGGTILIPALLFLTDINQHQAQGVAPLCRNFHSIPLSGETRYVVFAYNFTRI